MRLAAPVRPERDRKLPARTPFPEMVRRIARAHAAPSTAGERRYRVGRNAWYVAPGKRARLVLKTRRGRVREIGLASKRLTRSRPATRGLLRAWHL
jgi:hypothetical protein